MVCLSVCMRVVLYRVERNKPICLLGCVTVLAEGVILCGDQDPQGKCTYGHIEAADDRMLKIDSGVTELVP